MGINALPLPTREVFVNIQLPNKMDCAISLLFLVFGLLRDGKMYGAASSVEHLSQAVLLGTTSSQKLPLFVLLQGMSI